jgi:hypothetical protein
VGIMEAGARPGKWLDKIRRIDDTLRVRIA